MVTMSIFSSVTFVHLFCCGYHVFKISDYFHLFNNTFQIQHPRSDLNRFDLVIAPRHDYYPLTPHAQQQIPWFLRRWITPREPPGKNVVGVLDGKYFNEFFPH